MIFRVEDSDDGPTLVLDEEGIDYLMVGLEHLRDTDHGGAVSAPSLAEDVDGEPSGVGVFILRRA